MARRSLGRQFGWLWAAYAVSAFGTWIAFDAFPLIAILVLHAGPAQVSLLAAAGLAVGAVVAVPLGPWVEFRRKRPVMIAMDLVRFAALMSVPAAYALGWLSFGQLAGGVGRRRRGRHRLQGGQRRLPEGARAAGGPARRERPVRVDDVDRHRARTAAGRRRDRPVRPGDDVVADAVSYLLSAVGIRAIGGDEPRPERPGAPRLRAGDLLDGWRYILAHPALRPLFFNTMLVNGLIMATEPLLAVLMLGRPRVRAVAVRPRVRGCPASAASSARGWPAGSSRGSGSTGSCAWPGRCARAGRSGWPSSGPASPGLVLVIAVELGLITCVSVFNPVYRHLPARADTETDRVARTLSAWSISSSATIAALTALWGLLAGLTGPRTAIAIAGILILATPLLLPRHDHTRQPEELAQPS